MPTTISLTYPIASPKRFDCLTINLSEIYRTLTNIIHGRQVKLALETITIFSLFTVVFVWLLVLPII